MQPPTPWEDIVPVIQDLFLIIYGSIEGYQKAGERHPAEPALLLYNQIFNEPEAPYTVGLELGIALLMEEPLDLNGYLLSTLREYLLTESKEIPIQVNGYSLSLSQVISMTPEGWGEFLHEFHHDEEVDYRWRTDFTMQRYYILPYQEEESKEELGELTAQDLPFQFTKTMNEEREDIP